MYSNSLFLFANVSQWGLFVGIGLILFGIIEKNEKIIWIGQFIFLALGFLSGYILLTHSVESTPAVGDIGTKEMAALSYFKSIGLFTGLTILSLTLKLFKLRLQKASLYLLVFFRKKRRSVINR